MAGLPGGTAIASTFVAKSTGVPLGETGVGDLLHVGFVGRGEDVGGCALGDLGDEVARTGEDERHGRAGVRLLEVVAELGERLGQGRGGEDGDRIR